MVKRCCIGDKKRCLACDIILIFVGIAIGLLMVLSLYVYNIPEPPQPEPLKWIESGVCIKWEELPECSRSLSIIDLDEETLNFTPFTMRYDEYGYMELCVIKKKCVEKDLHLIRSDLNG